MKAVVCQSDPPLVPVYNGEQRGSLKNLKSKEIVKKKSINFGILTKGLNSDFGILTKGLNSGSLFMKRLKDSGISLFRNGGFDGSVFYNHFSVEPSMPMCVKENAFFSSTTISKDSLKAFKKIESLFPGSLSNLELVGMVSRTFAKSGHVMENTLLATSLCCDEVNRSLESDLSRAFGQNFSMGGLAGFPFSGITGFGAMAAHIPDGGSCLVIYGPHVGVDADGNVGTLERRGRANGGSCCGSATEAAHYVRGVNDKPTKEAKMPEDALDAQQQFVRSMLLPYAEQLDEADDTMLALPKAVYDSQSIMMKRIIGRSKIALPGEGLIFLLGGIQINTPAGYTDYYQPLSFELYNGEGDKIDDLLANPLDNTSFPFVKHLYPGAYTNSELLSAVACTLDKCGYAKKKTLVAASFCCDEYNSTLQNIFSKFYGANVNMGGLSEYPCKRITQDDSTAAHIPDRASCLIVHGTHVGIDLTGAVCTAERKSVAKGNSCGSVKTAAKNGNGIYKKEIGDALPMNDISAQQIYMRDMLVSYAKDLAKSKDKMLDLPRALSDAQKKMVTILAAEATGGHVGSFENVAILSGIQISTPQGFSDYFLPLTFELYNSKGCVIDNLLPKLNMAPKIVIKSLLQGVVKGNGMTSCEKEKGARLTLPICKETKVTGKHIKKWGVSRDDKMSSASLSPHGHVSTLLLWTLVSAWFCTVFLWELIRRVQLANVASVEAGE